MMDLLTLQTFLLKGDSTAKKGNAKPNSVLNPRTQHSSDSTRETVKRARRTSGLTRKQLCDPPQGVPREISAFRGVHLKPTAALTHPAYKTTRLNQASVLVYFPLKI